MKKKLDNVAIKEISSVLCEYTTGSELAKMFHRLNFFDYDSTHLPKLSTKWRRIENTLTIECHKSHSAKPIFTLCEQILNPASFMKAPESWREAKKSLNGILIFYGFQLNDLGKIENAQIAASFTDAQKRLRSFQEKLDIYDIHPEVMRYCKEELFVEDYFHAILEASKGLLERIRNLSGRTEDGTKLIDLSFSTKNYNVLIKNNYMQTETEKSEFNGLKSLLNTIIYMYRNPSSHQTRLYNPRSETEAVTAFTLISLAHRILDNCFNVRDLDKS